MNEKPTPILDQPLEFTEKGIPISLRPFFQEYVLENLDPDLHAFTVMERALAWGDFAELRWLFGAYPRSMLRAYVEQYGWRGLPLLSFNYWANYFDVEIPERGERIWPH